jgi:hypothetical protein
MGAFGINILAVLIALIQKRIRSIGDQNFWRIKNATGKIANSCGEVVGGRL